MENKVIESVLEELYSTVSDEGMLDSARSVLVGFSGGADSVTLLDILDGYCRERGIKLSALHLNHRIRGAEADRDEAFCREFCRARDIELYVFSEDIPALAKREGLGLEEAARNRRYELFAECAEKIGADRIATAHNATDNIETVLFNMVRGSGLGGLCGIPPVRGSIIRPLIRIPKESIVAYCHARGLDFCVDTTNSDTDYTRNYIRNEILPRLRSINPRAEDSVSRLCLSLREDERELERAAEEYSLSSGRETLASLSAGCLSRVLRREYKALTGRTLESVHTQKMAELVRSDKAHARLSLPGEADFAVDRDTVFFATDKDKAEYSAELRPGENHLPRGGVAYLANMPLDDDAEKDIKRLKNIYKISMNTAVDFGKINGTVVARSRRDGDSVRIGGMNRKLKKLLQSLKLTERERAALPVFCDADGIIWVPHFKPADRASGEDNNLHIFYFGD